MFAKLMESACEFFERHLTDDLRDLLLTKYGFTRETISSSRIGFAPVDSGDLLAYLFDICDDPDILLRSGMFYKTTYSIRPLWQGRIMFPYLQGGAPTFFIGREIDGITADGLSGKYVKQRVKSQKNPEGFAVEPIFGVDTIRTGDTLIITEGIADAIACHQAGYAAISPVTTRFKERHCQAVSALCQRANRSIIIMDSEVSEAGLIGACKTAYDLLGHGITCFIGEIPRPDHLDKIDIAEYLKTGGLLEPVIESSLVAYEHPRFTEIKTERWKESTRKSLDEIRRKSHRTIPRDLGRAGSYSPRNIDIDSLRKSMPSLEYFTKVRPGQRGSHPQYGSLSGSNLEMSADGDRWFCYHEGSRGDGDLFKWIAVYELRLITESERLDGIAFITTIQHCWRTYGPGKDRFVSSHHQEVSVQ